MKTPTTNPKNVGKHTCTLTKHEQEQGLHPHRPDDLVCNNYREELIVSNDATELLEGTTLNVYIYVAKEGKPLGPRDVMRGVHLSSPSVAYRHLQKLESVGLLKKNDYGEYVLKEKAKVSGFYWVGRNLLPRTMFYFFFFFGLFILEIAVLAIHWVYETYEIKVFFALGLSITGIAMAFFLLEGIMMLRRIKLKNDT